MVGRSATTRADRLRHLAGGVQEAEGRPAASAVGIDSDRRIAFQGGEGPFGFKPEELERAIERELA
jgi:hypothetical protein